MNGVLSDQLYNNFLLLFVSSTILLSRNLAHDDLYEYADKLLKLFMSDLDELYGHTMLVYNVHGLTHLASDAKRFGCLDKISAFSFENALKSLKRLIRKSQFPLQQICRRLGESEQIKQLNDKRSSFPTLHRQHFQGPLTDGCVGILQFKEIKLETMFLSTAEADNCVLTASNGPCFIRNIVKGKDVQLVVEACNIIDDVFLYPMPSSSINVYKVSQMSGMHILIPISDVVYKFVCLPWLKEANSFVLLPLLHTCI